MKLKAIIVDVDGTLALRDPDHRGPHEHDKADADAVNEPVRFVVNTLSTQIKIIVTSARQEKYRLVTEVWLKFHGIRFDALLMRPTKDNRPDHDVKEEIYAEQIEPFYEVFFVLDDRNKVVEMWRDIGLKCWQVAEGDF